MENYCELVKQNVHNVLATHTHPGPAPDYHIEKQDDDVSPDISLDRPRSFTSSDDDSEDIKIPSTEEDRENRKLV